MDQLVSLRVFCAVVELGSFVAAAESLTMSTSMVSKHVMQLEQRLGARLLQRTSRRLSLTEVGRVYWENVRQLLADLDEADAAVSLHARHPQGWLRVAAPAWFSAESVTRWLLGFQQSQPEVSLDLDLNDRLVDLVEDGIDVALRITATPPAASVTRRLCPIQFLLVASPDYLAGVGPVESLAGLAGLPLLDYSNLNQGGRLRHGSETVEMRPVVRSNSTALIYQAALQGQGLALLPTWLVQAEVVGGRLKVVLPQLSWPAPNLYALCTSRRYLSGRVRAFLQYLHDSLSEKGEL